MPRTPGHLLTGLSLAACLLMPPIMGGGCQRAYYSAMEAFGKHKRDLLVARVEDARDEQNAAKEQFATALERLTALLEQEDESLSSLRRTYDSLNTELQRSERRAAAVRDRIADVERVAADLFAEWESELNQYSDAALREASRRQLGDTRGRYGELIGAMNAAAGRMEPVLVAFRDQVLFIKHNLNAQAVASLRGNVASLEREITDLIAQMERSIAEAESFISAMGRE